MLNTTSVAANRSPITGWLVSCGREEVPTSAESEVNRLQASIVNNNTYIVRQCVWYWFENLKTVVSFDFRATSAQKIESSQGQSKDRQDVVAFYNPRLRGP